jgi:hypothetical protein
MNIGKEESTITSERRFSFCGFYVFPHIKTCTLQNYNDTTFILSFDHEGISRLTYICTSPSENGSWSKTPMYNVISDNNNLQASCVYRTNAAVGITSVFVTSEYVLLNNDAEITCNVRFDWWLFFKCRENHLLGV